MPFLIHSANESVSSREVGDIGTGIRIPANINWHILFPHINFLISY